MNPSLIPLHGYILRLAVSKWLDPSLDNQGRDLDAQNTFYIQKCTQFVTDKMHCDDVDLGLSLWVSTGSSLLICFTGL